LQALAASGTLKPADLVWHEGLSQWMPAGSVEGLFADIPPIIAEPTRLSVATDAATPSAGDIPPAAAPARVLPYLGGGVAISVSPRTMELLRQTRPWVLFLGIIGFVITGFILIAGIAIVSMSAMGSPGRGAAEPMLIGGMYILVGIAYFCLSLYLCRFASRIGKLQTSGSVDDLESALMAQKSFWRLSGIMVIAGLVAYLVLIAVLTMGLLR
jgi:hypothetical protein